MIIGRPKAAQGQELEVSPAPVSEVPVRNSPSAMGARREPRIALPTGTASKKLKPWQKLKLVELAAAAYDRAITFHSTDDLSLAAWRQREALKSAAGVRISEAEQRHYNDLKAHFQVMAGESGKGFETTLREHTSPERVARFKLNEELAKHGLLESYASHIARCKFKQTVLDKLTAKQLWSLVYDVRRTHTKAAKAARGQTKGQPHP